MARVRYAVRSLFLALTFFSPQETSAQEISRETLPDGRTVEFETLPGPDGTALRHGSFKVFGPGGEEWVVNGEYENGAQDGRWIFRYASGEKVAAGSYRDGVRSGRWKFYWQSGDLASEGVFKNGEPRGKWLFYELGGEKGGGLPVEIAVVEGSSSEDGCAYSGLLGDGEPIGWWKIVRLDGSTLFEGAFNYLGRLRSCAYRHAGGVSDPDFFAGARGAVHPDDYAFQALDEYGQIRVRGDFPSGEGESGLAGGLAFVQTCPGLKDVKALPLQPLSPDARIYQYAPGSLVRELEFRDPEAAWTEVAGALKTACTIDWKSSKGRIAALELFQDIIEPGLGYPDLGIDFAAKEPRLERSQLALLRVHSLLSMRRGDLDFWTVDARLANTWPLENRTLPVIARIDPTLWLDAKDRKTLGAQRKKALKARANALKSASKRGPSESAQAVRKALDWIVAEQREDGSWPAGTSSLSEDAAKTPHPESRGHDVGVTALAVLALARDPLTPGDDERLRAIRRGCAYLLSSRQGSQGLFLDIFHSVTPEGKSARMAPALWMYGQAATLQALCEVQDVITTPRLQVAVEDAAAALMRAKNPYGCWRYASPPNGDHDVSVTYWVTRALLKAERAGVPLQDVARRHVMDFLDELTDDGTGRTGYVERGSPSVRVQGLNAHFPMDSGETLTAEAITLRYGLGSGASERCKRGAELLIRRLPEWDRKGLQVDYGYWFAGTEALRLVGDKYWETWSKAVAPALLESQVASGSGEGSWPPIGVWCLVGGRTYATATAAMTLQLLADPPQ